MNFAEEIEIRLSTIVAFLSGERSGLDPQYSVADALRDAQEAHAASKSAMSAITFNTPEELAAALKRAADAHHKYEQELGHADGDWPTWYADYMRKEQLEDKLVGYLHPKL